MNNQPFRSSFESARKSGENMLFNKSKWIPRIHLWRRIQFFKVKPNESLYN